MKRGNNMSNMIMENAKVMTKGQVTLPKEIRNVLGVNSGDGVSFIYDGNNVLLINSAVYAMKYLQENLKSTKNGFKNEKELYSYMSKNRKH